MHYSFLSKWNAAYIYTYNYYLLCLKEAKNKIISNKKILE